MKSLKTLLTFMTVVMLASCNTDDLCYQHPHDGDVRIIFDWSKAPDAAPEGMHLCVYSATRQFSQPFDLPSQGGVINITDDIYHFISHNNDVEWVNTFNANTFDGHCATTRECDILEPMYGRLGVSTGLRGEEDERVFATADRLYVGVVEDCDVMQNRSITIAPVEYTCHYTFEFRNVGSVKHIRRAAASISGMSPEVSLADGSLSTEPVTLALEAYVGNQKSSQNSINGSFYTFGHHEDVSAPHRMALYVELDTGQKIKFTVGDYLDVTDQIHSAPDYRRVHIVIDGIDLPEPIENGSGFSPGVDDWSVEETEIKM